MFKKIFISLLILAVLVAALTVLAVNIIQRKAPDILRQALERSLDKKVVVKNIVYHFPRTFELEGLEVHEKGEPFEGDISFYVDRVTLDLSPMAFSQKALIITAMSIEGAEIVIRKFQGRLFHVFSGVIEASGQAPRLERRGGKIVSGVNLPLEIHEITLKDCHFKLADYDAGPGGFVMTFDKINAKIKNAWMPSERRRTSYEISAELLQGRDQRRARVRFSGWTSFDTLDTDAICSMEGAHLPYFRPYYEQVTGALLEDGFADLRAVIKMKQRVLELNVGFELSSLLFSAYEQDNQLFGMKADEVLAFLKDSSGKLRFQIAVQWNTADKSVNLKDVFRRSIERSLRQTLLGSVGDVLMNALQKAVEGSDGPGKNPGLEEKIKKIKDFFKY